MDDAMNEGDLSKALAVFFINDAGHKKKNKFTQRLVAFYLETEGRVVIRHCGASVVGKGQLASVVQADARRLGVLVDLCLGSCTDSANDVLVTFVNDMTLANPSPKS